MPSQNIIHPLKFALLLVLLSFLSLNIGTAGRPEVIAIVTANSAAVELVSNNSGDNLSFFYADELFPAAKPALLKNFSGKTLVYNFSDFSIREKIMDTGQLSMERMLSFLWLHNQNLDLQEARKLSQLYLEESRAEGVNHDIAFGQMCLETGYLKYTGDVSREQHNYCGLGATGNAEPGLFFANPREGVRAHIQHLKAYGSTDSLNHKLVDSRFRFVKRGSAQRLNKLTGNWASDPLYHHKINSILRRLYDGSYAQTPPNTAGGTNR
ncbi:MAG: glucosaminidase domain-containing protein [Bacteroidales bacterium]|nr:glucosaminidase domain-containing protein [Bacteroidales bacterium]